MSNPRYTYGAAMAGLHLDTDIPPPLPARPPPPIPISPPREEIVRAYNLEYFMGPPPSYEDAIASQEPPEVDDATPPPLPPRPRATSPSSRSLSPTLPESPTMQQLQPSQESSSPVAHGSSVEPLWQIGMHPALRGWGPQASRSGNLSETPRSRCVMNRWGGGCVSGKGWYFSPPGVSICPPVMFVQAMKRRKDKPAAGYGWEY
jgi:hypothetical protein